MACCLVDEHSNATYHGCSTLTSVRQQWGFPRVVDDVVHELMFAYQFGRNGDALRIRTGNHAYRSGIHDQIGTFGQLSGSLPRNRRNLGGSLGTLL